VQPIVYADMSRGWDPLAPPRSLVPGPQSPAIWRNALNVVGRDGLLQGRPKIAALAASATQPPLAPAAVGAFLAQHKGEIPVWIYTAVSPIGATASAQTGSCAPEYSYPGGAETTVVITTRGIYLSIDSCATWKNVTPTYVVGTVAVTNGSAAVVGTGTSWATYGISPLQYVTIAGVTYQICTVTDDTHLTLATAYAGATAAGLAYTIVRTFPGGTTLERASLIFAQVFNQNLYVAGTFLGRADGQPKPCVIKVSNILSGSPTTAYLVSNALLQASPAMDVIAGHADISGLQLAQDGRVVLTGDENVVYWSSNLNGGDAVWTVSPGGFSAIVLKGGPIHAAGKLNNNLTLHFEDGIVLGIPQSTGPTGDGSPPFAFQETSSDVGCFCPRTLKHGGGGWQGCERFVGADGSVYEFNGFMTTEIGRQIRQVFVNVDRQVLRSHLHAAFDTFRGGEYILFREASPLTLAWRYQVEWKRWWPSQLACPIGTVSDRDDRALSRQDSQQLVGVASQDLRDGSPRSVLWGYSEALFADAVQPFGGATAGGYLVETDDLDAQLPLNYKFIRRVIVWFRGLAAGPETLQVMLSRDGGVTWQLPVAKTVQHVVGGEQPIAFSFAEYDWLSAQPPPGGGSFVYLNSGATGHILRVRLATTDQAALRSAWTRMEIEIEVSGNLEMISLGAAA
jgi:hypothetical protein